jgi:uncharacterized protein (TIGR02588 family)
MAIWFLRVSAAICLAAIVSVVGLTGRDWYRDAADAAAMATAQQRVEALGGSFSWEAADSEYVIALHNTAVTDAELVELVGLLQPLAGDSPRTPGAMQEFAFNLAGTKIGDEGMQAISALPVAWLNLNDTRITDRGLLHLRNQRRIGIVTVGGTSVTQPGIDTIRLSLPHIWIPVHTRSRSGTGAPSAAAIGTGGI